MTTFYVGQLVRIVSVLHKRNSHVVGIETVVTGFSALGNVETEFSRRFSAGTYHDPTHLEPILYDGNKTVDWSECLWQPSHQGAPA